MALDLFFQEDARRILDTLETAAGHLENEDFRRGWLACASAAKVGFGLQPTTVIIPMKGGDDERSGKS